MKMKLFTVIMLVVLFIVSGCEKGDENNYGAEIDVKESNKSSVEYDADKFWGDQKIVFIMSVSSYAEPYAEGYFIDTVGKKHIYGLYEHAPFETIDFFDDTSLRNCTEYLYHVNMDSKLKTEGTAIMDFPLKQLYGIRMIDGHEEFIFLGSETGISERLDDPSADQIFEEFGDTWYLLR